MDTLSISTISIVLIIISSLSFAGCVNTDNEQEIIQMSTSLSLNTTNIKEINFSQIKEPMNESGFGIENESKMKPDHHYLSYHIFEPRDKDPQAILSISLIVEEKDGKSYIKIRYSKRFKESQMEEKKGYVKGRVKEVAEICNLTVDWSQAEWTVNYAD